MRYAAAFFATVLAGLPAGLAHAQGAERYRLERTEDGYVRMDVQTGAMSICTERSGQLVCRVAADERTAYSDELEALQTRVEALEKRLAALEHGDRPAAGSTLPSDEDVEKTLGIMERFFRRFMSIVQDFDKDLRQDEPGSAKPGASEPNRT